MTAHMNIEIRAVRRCPPPAHAVLPAQNHPFQGAYYSAPAIRGVGSGAQGVKLGGMRVKIEGGI